MGLGEGNIIALNFNYALNRVIPVLFLYFFGVLTYLAGLFILANRIGSVIGIWEAVAIGLAVSTAVIGLVKAGHKVPFSAEILVWGLLLALGVLLVIIAGDKFISFYFPEE